MAKLSDRATRLKELLVMMECEPQKFAQEALCDPRILTKLLPEDCEPAIANDPSPRKRTKTTLRFKALEYIANGTLTRDHAAILGPLFFWEMYLNRPEVGQYREISLDKVVDYWCDPGSLIDFMDGPVKHYLEIYGKNELSRSVQEFSNSDKGISLLLNRILPNSKQSRTNQVRGLANFLNATTDRLALEIERVSLEIHGVSALAMPQGDPSKTAPPAPDILPRLREFIRRNCKNLSPLCGIQMEDKTLIFRTFETDSDPLHSKRIESVEPFRNTTGVLVSPPHTGKTTYVKMLALKNAEAETDCVAVYINAVDLKNYALLKRSVYEFVVNQLIGEGLAKEEDFEMDVAALQHADRNRKIIFFVDNPEGLNSEQESALILLFSFCKQVFFVTTPWAAASVKSLMAEYNPNREVKTYSLRKLTPSERDELVSFLGQQYAGFQEAADKFLAHTYSSLFDQPIGLVALAAEYLRTGGFLSELFTAQRIMNALLVQAGLDSYEINFHTLSRKSYRLAYLSIILDNLNTPKNNIVRMGEDPKLFWPVSLLVEDFSLQPKARDAFVRTFLEPDPNDPRLVRFFIRDLQYLLVAIHHVISDVWEGRFIGVPKDVVNSCVPLEQRSPDLDPSSIVQLYQVDLLSYFMNREVDVDTSH